MDRMILLWETRYTRIGSVKIKDHLTFAPIMFSNMLYLQSWMVLLSMFCFHPYLGKLFDLTDTFLKWVEATNYKSRSYS